LAIVKDAFNLFSFLLHAVGAVLLAFLVFLLDVVENEEFDVLLLLLIVDDEEIEEEEEHDDEDEADEGLHMVDNGGDKGG
jgi:hypothetical protein